TGSRNASLDALLSERNSRNWSILDGNKTQRSVIPEILHLGTDELSRLRIGGLQLQSKFLRMPNIIGIKECDPAPFGLTHPNVSRRCRSAIVLLQGNQPNPGVLNGIGCN